MADASIPATKVCRTCKVEKSLDQFSPNPGGRLGRYSRCYECARAARNLRNAENREHARQVRRDWEAANPAKVKAARLRSQNKHREKIRAVNREWHRKNPGAVARALAKRIENDPEKVARQRASYTAAYRARKIDAGGDYKSDDVRALHAAQKGRCWYCQKTLVKYHVDHRIPLARGGSNYPANLVLACPSCNCSKGAKMPWEMDSPRLL